MPIHQCHQLDPQDDHINSLPKLTSRQAHETDELAGYVAAYEGRVRRLEDAVFNKTS